MPEMDFLNWYEDEELQALHLSAVMLFPAQNEIEKRNQWLAKSLLGYVGRWWEGQYPEAQDKGDTLELSQYAGAWLGELLHGNGGWGVLCKAVVGGKALPPGEGAREREGQGLLSGELLARIIEDWEGKSKHGLAYICDKISPDLEAMAKELPNGAHLPIDAEYLRKRWPRFRPAAHFWLAYISPAIGWKPKRFKPYAPLTSFPGGLPGFLALAESFRLRAEKIFPPTGRRTPAIPPAEAWRIPQGYALPFVATPE